MHHAIFSDWHTRSARRCFEKESRPNEWPYKSNCTSSLVAGYFPGGDPGSILGWCTFAEIKAKSMFENMEGRKVFNHPKAKTQTSCQVCFLKYFGCKTTSEAAILDMTRSSGSNPNPNHSNQHRLLELLFLLFVLRSSLCGPFAALKLHI